MNRASISPSQSRALVNSKGATRTLKGASRGFLVSSANSRNQFCLNGVYRVGRLAPHGLPRLLGHIGRNARPLAAVDLRLLHPLQKSCAVQPILAETETIVAHRDGCSCCTTAPRGNGPQARTCCLSACSWLHLLKSWSLRQTRSGSVDKPGIPLAVARECSSWANVSLGSTQPGWWLLDIKSAHSR